MGKEGLGRRDNGSADERTEDKEGLKPKGQEKNNGEETEGLNT